VLEEIRRCLVFVSLELVLAIIQDCSNSTLSRPRELRSAGLLESRRLCRGVMVQVERNPMEGAQIREAVTPDGQIGTEDEAAWRGLAGVDLRRRTVRTIRLRTVDPRCFDPVK